MGINDWVTLLQTFTLPLMQSADHLAQLITHLVWYLKCLALQ